MKKNNNIPATIQHDWMEGWQKKSKIRRLDTAALPPVAASRVATELRPKMKQQAPTFSRVLLGSPFFSRFLLGSPVRFRILLGSSVFSRVLLGSPVFSRDLLGSPVLSKVLLSSPFFSRVLQFSPGFSSNQSRVFNRIF